MRIQSITILTLLQDPQMKSVKFDLFLSRTFYDFRQIICLKNIIVMQNTPELQGIIKKNFKQSEQSLNLQSKHSQWMKVLEFRDWNLLRQMNLRQCKINDKNIKNLVERQWPVLRKLLLWKNQLSVHGIKKLLEKEWPSLEFIELDNNQIGNEGLILLGDAYQTQKLKKLKRLQVGGNKITKLHLGLSDTTTIKNLEHLTLSENQLGSSGIKMLRKAKMPYLQDINLNNCHIGDEGVHHLIKTEWPNLQYLHLQKNGIGCGFLILPNNNWKKLRYASIGENNQNGNISYLVDGAWGLAMVIYQNRSFKIQKNIHNTRIKEYLKEINKKMCY